MSAMVSQITSLKIVSSTVYSGADQRKQLTLAFVRETTGEFPVLRSSNAENVSIRWRHHVLELELENVYLTKYMKQCKKHTII